jgi:flagellar hook-associated protein 1 FlgK
MANSISSALLVATSGLRAAQAGIDTVTRNVANADVDGYTRKQSPLESLALLDTNAGVRALEARRFVNDSLLRQLRVSNSATQRLETEDDFLGRFETIFGKPGDDITITAKIGALADAFRALSVSPDLGTSQFKVLSAAESMVQNLNLVSKTIRGLREEADAAISSSVDRVNNALGVIHELNLQIATLKAQSKSTADLEDQRDLQINIVAEEIDISYFQRDNGEIWISTRAGRSLLDAAFDPDSPPLSFTPTSVILPSSAYYPPAVSATFGGLSGLEVNGQDATQELVGGKMAAYFAIRDEYLPATEAQLDEVAAQMIEKFNFLDLQLFRDGTSSIPANYTTAVAKSAGDALTSGATAIEITDATGLSVGMTVKFANHDTVYQITGIDTSTTPDRFTIEQTDASAPTGLSDDVPAFTNITFGPAIPRLTNDAAAAISTTTLTLTTAAGASAGMRIKFANHETIYTVTAVVPATPTPGTATQITIVPDGGGTGLRAAVTADEAISVLHPVPNIGGLSSRIVVNPVVSNNPWRVRDGTRVDTPSTLTGANTLPLSIVSMFETQQTFTANTGLSTSATMEGFAASAVSFQAVRRETILRERDAQVLIRDNFDQRFKNDSGVNVDQELAFMIQVQNSYAASARVITAIREMLDELLRVV